VALPLARLAAGPLGLPEDTAIKLLASGGTEATKDVGMSLGLLWWTFLERMATLAATVVAAGVAGSLIMGLYLWVSLRLLNRHINESFSSLRIQDYKNFLRLHIDRSGQLTIFAVGLDRVPRRWQVSEGEGSTERLVPEKAPLCPHLIEQIKVG
jgi:hypothetical protein